MSTKTADVAWLPGFVEYPPGEDSAGQVMAVNVADRDIEKGETIFIGLKTKKEVEQILRDWR